MLESSELEERINQNESIQETIKQFRESRIDLSDDQYPSVAFLGTVSATSIKYRNVSGHLLQLNAKTSILIDCGEGTFGQLRSIFSPDRIDDILLSLKAVFITHAHYDHIGGLITVIERRVEAFENKGMIFLITLLFDFRTEICTFHCSL
jgi:ribonuclease Z